MPHVPGEVVEGVSDDLPLKLEGIHIVDFEQLLSVLYPT